MKRTILTVVISILLTGAAVTVYAGSHPVTIDDHVFMSARSVSRAIRLMRAGSWRGARAELEYIIQRHPRNHYALFDLGILYEREGNRRQAEKYVRRASDLRRSRYYLDALARIRGVRDRRSDLYQRIFHCFGECDTGNYYARAGLWEDALDHYESFFQRYPDSHIACFHIAVAWEALGNRDRAIRYCEDAIRIKGWNTRKYENFLTYLESTATRSDAPVPPETFVDEEPVPEVASWPTAEPESNPRDRAPSSASAADEAAPPEYRYVAVDVVNLRTDPSEQGKRIQLLHRGSRVTYLKPGDDWLYVRTFHGQEGWLPADSLALTADAAWVNPPVSGAPARDDFRDDTAGSPELAGKTGRVNRGDGAAVRAEPSLLAKTIYTFHKGDRVSILNRSRSNWVFVRSPAGAGYMLIDQLTLD